LLVSRAGLVLPPGQLGVYRPPPAEHVEGCFLLKGYKKDAPRMFFRSASFLLVTSAL
jgi:hypothetical protein